MFDRFPEIVKALLQRISESNCNNDKISAAKNKLISQLNSITIELEKLANTEGESLTEEQKDILKSLSKYS